MEIPLAKRRAALEEIRAWVSDARDAAEACKLAIVRLSRPEDIAVVGEHLDQHERFARELERSLADEPATAERFHDAPAIGATLGDAEVLRALARIEDERAARIERALRERGPLTEILGDELRRARARRSWAHARAIDLERAHAA